jgi:hypothetical protein
MKNPTVTDNLVDYLNILAKRPITIHGARGENPKDGIRHGGYSAIQIIITPYVIFSVHVPFSENTKKK